MTLIRRVAALLLTAGFCAACGSGTPSSPAPGSGDAGTITGRERIGWDQQAASASELAAIKYAVYVDGARSILPDVSCGSTAAASGFPCSARLPAMTPGAHTLEIASFIEDGGAESAKSSPLRVTVSASAQPSAVSAAATIPAEVSTPDGARLRVHVVTDSLRSATSLAFASDGRVFVAERAGRVRVVKDGGLDSEPALVEDDVYVAARGGGILALALDPSFDDNHFAYVLDVTSMASGSPTFRLTRYREAGGRFGERAVLLSDVPAAADRASGSLLFGSDGKLYAAVDSAVDAALALRPSALNGKVLRLNSDGTTPSDQASASPVYSLNHEAPVAADWQPDADVLWVLDAPERDRGRMTAIAPDAGAERKGRVVSALALAEEGATSMAFYRSSRVPALSGNLLVATQTGQLVRLRLDPSRTIVRSARPLIEGLGPLDLVAVDRFGVIYLASETALLRLSPDN
jgi:glucose/arabinose dehydrogenase